MTDPRHELGRRGEDLAARHLQEKGCRIVGRNLRNSIGELDLVVLDGLTVVIVEVKTRGRTDSSPAQAVDYRKQRKLTQTATLFLKSRNWLNRPIRFDVVEITLPSGATPYIRHIKSAFNAVSY